MTFMVLMAEIALRANNTWMALRECSNITRTYYGEEGRRQKDHMGGGGGVTKGFGCKTKSGPKNLGQKVLFKKIIKPT